MNGQTLGCTTNTSDHSGKKQRTAQEPSFAQEVYEVAGLPKLEINQLNSSIVEISAPASENALRKLVFKSRAETIALIPQILCGGCHNPLSTPFFKHSNTRSSHVYVAFASKGDSMLLPRHMAPDEVQVVRLAIATRAYQP